MAKRYFFARIDEFLAENMNLQPKHPLANLVTKTSATMGFHVEHIALPETPRTWRCSMGMRSDLNRSAIDLAEFYFLKGRDNISSNELRNLRWQAENMCEYALLERDAEGGQLQIEVRYCRIQEAFRPGPYN